ncbi:UDP-N-acetylglucosamine 2-epimerase (non-hydrolyzing) [Legionella israelensis]|uniref:non-hydrolyzing UDP-N-acetylglucosamine 2-epimerase n=1 Tax=Legionella israelensis TaxID=454 RepID=UPI00117D9F81|nr:UDP-N-acetylglucosamine 2-epimerase (non-hydrolyzing) [Legionella israelensis]QDP72358.1 UDP-N-acetylglucosamine 2-epimerase (non-hydrolyzing) [Legionella israelensis]
MDIVNTLCVFGTRPEAIKMAPIIKKLTATQRINNKVCVTGQHQQLLDSVLDLFSIYPDFNLQVMTENQDLNILTCRILTGLSEIYKSYKPHLVIVHGDTTTTFVAALSAYYHQIPIAHIEAGLRTGHLYSPWPEEANRKLTGVLTNLHFAPTDFARQNLLMEGVAEENIYITGNTVIDALYDMVEKIESQPSLRQKLKEKFPYLNEKRKMILVTGHRRENFGDCFARICQALAEIAYLFPEVDIVYPVHLNPRVQGPVRSTLKDIENIYLIDPVDYLPFVYLMKSAFLILTDSGGIQEEAPSLGKPVLVMRDTTERMEAIKAGTVKLVGTDARKIINSVKQLLEDKETYLRMSRAQNPYGDGNAAERIVNVISSLNMENEKIPVFPSFRYKEEDFTC